MSVWLKSKGKKYLLPIYLPDATRGVVKSIDSIDLKSTKTRGVVLNTYHLMNNPTTKVLKGDIKNFMNFNGLCVTDSGGWQIYSLIKRGPKLGKITDEGVIFYLNGNKKIFTPAKSIKTQLEIGSDIVICLDDFTDPKASYKEAEKSVHRTILWAEKSKKIFDSVTKNMKNKPLIFAVIQGGYFKDLRKVCAESLIKIGFDGLGYGGYVINEKTNSLDLKLSKYIVNLIPQTMYKFALGIGRPEDIVNLHKMGWQIFDCTLPTRDARHMRLYKFKDNLKNPFAKNTVNKNDFYEYLYINKTKFATDFNKIDNNCNCYTCKNFTRGYLNHLFKIKDFTAYRLATIHNLYFYNKLIRLISQ